MTDIAYATGPQAQFILTLQGMPKDDDNRAEAALVIMESLSKAEASVLIDSLKSASLKPQTAPAAPACSKGEWHVFEEKFYLIARSQGSGHLYAKRRLNGGGFEFAPGIVKHLSTATKVGVAHLPLIQNFASQHDKCIFCSLPLDVPESRLAGYGSTCASNYGLPYGTH
jgi:hypothetical protein